MSLYPDSMYDFPNVSAYDSDLREVLAMLRGLTIKMRDFEVVNKITNAGAWDITKQYKPWTIVSDNNIGYISVRPVPAGIEITNTDYWALVADYDILITNLSERISALEIDNVINKAKITRKENRVSQILIVGDSYLDRSGSYGEYLASVLTDIPVILRGEAGAGFTSFSTLGGKTFEGILDTYAQSISEEARAEFSDVFVIGGSNDRGHATATVSAAINTWVTKARSYFTNAKVHIGFLGFTGFSNTYKSADKRSFNAMRDVYKAASVTNATKWIANLNYLMHDYNHFADEGHPDATLSQRIGEFLARYVLDGHADAAYNTKAGGTINSTNFSIGQFDQGLDAVTCEVFNGMAKIRVAGSTMSNFRNYCKMSFNVTGLTGNGGIAAIYTLNGGVYGVEDPDHGSPAITTVPARCVVNGADVSLPLSFAIFEGAFVLFYLNGVAGNWTQLSHMIIDTIEFTMPTDYV